MKIHTYKDSTMIFFYYIGEDGIPVMHGEYKTLVPPYKNILMIHGERMPMFAMSDKEKLLYQIQCPYLRFIEESDIADG